MERTSDTARGVGVSSQTGHTTAVHVNTASTAWTITVHGLSAHTHTHTHVHTHRHTCTYMYM